MRCTYLVGNNLQWFISLFQVGGHVQKSTFCSLFFHINLRSVCDSRQLHFLLFAYSGGADGVKNPSSALLAAAPQSLLVHLFPAYLTVTQPSKVSCRDTF